MRLTQPPAAVRDSAGCGDAYSLKSGSSARFEVWKNHQSSQLEAPDQKFHTKNLKEVQLAIRWLGPTNGLRVAGSFPVSKP